MPLDPKEFEKELSDLPSEDIFDFRVYSVQATYRFADPKDVELKYAMNAHFKDILDVIGGKVEEWKNHNDGVEVILTNPDNDDFSGIAPVKNKREFGYEDYRLEFDAPVGDGITLRWVDIELLA